MLEPDDYAYRASITALSQGHLLLSTAQYQALAHTLGPGGGLGGDHVRLAGDHAEPGQGLLPGLIMPVHLFHNQNMCAALDDRKTAAIIRDSAMRLFAERGASGVTIREVATAAGVSPSLVMHHFGSRDGLKDAVDHRAVEFVDDMIAEFARLEAEGGAVSLAGLFSDWLEREPAMIGYLRRLLIDGGDAAAMLFGRLLGATADGIRSLVAAGVMRPAPDEELRAAFLITGDLAMMLLRPQILHATGIDPLSREGLARWTETGLDIYSGGLFAAHAQPPGPPQVHDEREESHDGRD